MTCTIYILTPHLLLKAREQAVKQDKANAVKALLDALEEDPSLLLVPNPK